MYTLSLKKSFDSYHFLTGGDWGQENEKHKHNYEVEIKLKGLYLDKLGYLREYFASTPNMTGRTKAESYRMLPRLDKMQ